MYINYRSLDFFPFSSFVQLPPSQNLLDSGAGDGDCGSTLKRGAEKLLSLAEAHLGCTATVFDAVSAIAEAEMGGSAGEQRSQELDFLKEKCESTVCF